MHPRKLCLGSQDNEKRQSLAIQIHAVCSRSHARSALCNVCEMKAPKIVSVYSSVVKFESSILQGMSSPTQPCISLVQESTEQMRFSQHSTPDPLAALSLGKDLLYKCTNSCPHQGREASTFEISCP